MIQVYRTKREIGFKVSDDIYQKIREWTHSIDKELFKEQLSTGRFRNHALDPGILSYMKQAEARGEIMPYYGVGGGSGVCTYIFKITASLINLTVKHGESGKSINFSAPLKISRLLSGQMRGRRLKYDPTPYMIDEKLPEAWSGEPPKALICKIYGSEYKNLAKWPKWIDSQALSGRYEYSFSEVSIGPTGFVARVRDIESKDLIDITEYSDW